MKSVTFSAVPPYTMDVLSVSVRWHCFPPTPAMPGCWTPPNGPTRLARDGAPEPVHIEETEANFAVAWTGHYRIDGAAFIYSDRISGRVFTILGYPIDRIAQLR